MRDDAHRSSRDVLRAGDVPRGGTGGGRTIGLVGMLIGAIAFGWSAFQLWIASPLPYAVVGVVPLPNDTDTRSIHLGAALVLAFLIYPSWRRTAPAGWSWLGWALGLAGAGASLYLAVSAERLAARPGLPSATDLAVAAVGLVVVLEAARRALGPALVAIALAALGYVFLGHLAPGIVAWKGASFAKSMSHMWLTQEGVFGVALGVSTNLIFLFVLLGALLERAGAGNYFIWVAFALLGRFRGGPAKAAVVASAATGIVSGSSTANVVTTGTFTIPLMKRTGLTAEKAGAIEVASSTNGQLMPPVMGAAAFLMVEFVGIDYLEVVKHALLPAAISYVALLYIVHLESCKAGLKATPDLFAQRWPARLLRYALGLAAVVLLAGAVYVGLGWTRTVWGDASAYVAAAVLVVAYVALLYLASRVPDLPQDHDLGASVALGPVIASGLYFVLPVLLLVWCLVVERLSPGLSVFWACMLTVAILLSHKPAKDLMRTRRTAPGRLRESAIDLAAGMIAGARSMVGIAVATAAAGIIIGTVTLTGVGLVLTELIELISFGYLPLVLVFTALTCLVLGTGLPTTANYIVVSALVAPVIVSLGADHGLAVPLIAVHLFVFYFGILADDTPPVGIAAYAAAAISGASPIRTGLQGFAYDMRTAIIPFMFVFNPQLLLIDVGSPWQLAVVVASAVAAMLLVAAALQGWFLTRSRKWESAALLLVAFTLFRPDFWMDRLVAPLTEFPATQIYPAAAAAPDGAHLRIRTTGKSLEGDWVDRVVALPLGDAGRSGAARIADAAGLELRQEAGRLLIDVLTFDGAAARQNLEFGWEVVAVLGESRRPAEQWMYGPAFAILALVMWLQRRRSREPSA